MIKTIEGTKSYIIVVFEDDKKIMLSGELTIIPAFYADFNSIIKWEPPFDNEVIDEMEKKRIAQEIIEYSKDKELKVYID